MKRLIAGIVITCAAAAIVAPAVAQITITAADVSAQLAVGNFTTRRFDSTATLIDIGSRGSSSWNFSTLKSSSVLTLTSIPVAGTPFVSNFPGATHVLQGNASVVYQGTAIPAIAYVYFQLSTNLLNLGEGASVEGGAGSALEATTPPDVYYNLPSSLGTTWTSTYLDTTVYYLGTLPIYEKGVRHNASYIVDAFGLLTLPGGTVDSVLRIKKTDSTTAKSVGYIFLGKHGTLVEVNGSDPNAPDSGMITIWPPVQWAADINTSVTAAAPVPVKFSLEQNYPNPFNPSTVIAYAVPVRSRVRLTVYNVLGQLVAELVNGDVEAGSHSVGWHPSTASGVYLCRMDAVGLDKPAASFSKVQKMVYVR